MEDNINNKPIERLSLWVFDNLFYNTGEDCPVVGDLGSCDSMTRAEWTIVCLAKKMLTETDKDYRDYFDYQLNNDLL